MPQDFSGSPELDYEIIDGKYVKKKKPEVEAGPGLLDQAYEAVGNLFKPSSQGEQFGNKIEQFRKRGMPQKKSGQ